MSDILDSAVERVLKGDTNAFETIVRKVGPELRAWLAVRCPPTVDADEIAHQAFVKTFENLKRYKLGTTLQAWIQGIARNILLAEIKRVRESQRRAGPLELFLTQAREWTSPPEIEDERLALLQQCMEGVALPARELLNRRYSANASIQEIASETQRSEGAILKSLCMIRKKLQDCVERKMSARAVMEKGLQ